jgi:hypothetical protein
MPTGSTCRTSSGIRSLGPHLCSLQLSCSRATARIAERKGMSLPSLMAESGRSETYCAPMCAVPHVQDYLDDLCASYGSVITLAYYIAVPTNATDPASVISADLDVIKHSLTSEEQS